MQVIEIHHNSLIIIKIKLLVNNTRFKATIIKGYNLQNPKVPWLIITNRRKTSTS